MQIMRGNRFSGAFKSFFQKDYVIVLDTLDRVRDIRNNASHSKWHLIEMANDAATVSYIQNLLEIYRGKPPSPPNKNS